MDCVSGIDLAVLGADIQRSAGSPANLDFDESFVEQATAVGV